MVGTSGALLLGSALALQPPPGLIEPPPPEPQDETIVITGTRIQAPDRQSASPVESVQPEEFTITGVANVEQTLNQLPQLVPGFTTTSNNPGTGAATLDLRGLGSVRTLILVNGRRWIANDAGQIPEIDVNTIPAALIERVDIVTGGASAVYGSDAVTGVINFVLKDSLEGFDLRANQNITQRGDGRSSNIDLSWGTRFAGGRGNLLLSGGWLDQRPILQGDRDRIRFSLGDGCIVPGSADEDGVGTSLSTDFDQDCSDEGEEPGLIRFGSTIIPEGLIQGGPVLLPGPGGTLLPSGQTRFAPGGTLQRFVPADNYNFAPTNYLQVPLERWSANLLASFAISPAFEPYVEGSYIKTVSPQQLAPATALLGTGTGTVPILQVNLDNPFLDPQAVSILETSYGVDADGDRGFIGSFATGFAVNPAFDGDADGIVGVRNFRSRMVGLGPRQNRSERNAWRVLAGLRGELGGGFEYDLYFSNSDVRHVNASRGSASASRLQQAILARRDPATGEIVCIDPSNGCVPVNLFGVQDVSDAAIEFLQIDPEERTDVEEQVAEAIVRGPLLRLPGGMLRTVLGASWRRTSYVFQPDRSFETDDSIGFNPSIGAAGSTEVAEAFAEALLPLLAERRFAHELSAELGLRFSHYDSVGGVWTWKAMANWAPIEAIRFRGGLQRAVRAPNARELFEEPLISFGGAGDPCSIFFLTLLARPEIAAACERSGVDLANLPQDSSALVRTGGSTDLRAETAQTRTLGFVARPLRRVSLTVDYYDIAIEDAIGVFGGGPTPTVFGCIFSGGDPADPLCSAVTRAPTGELAFIDTPTANLAELRARGIDWQLAVGQPALGGQFQLNLSGSRTLESSVRYNDGLPPLDCAGWFGQPCGNTIVGTGIPKWKLYNRATWSRASFDVTLRHRFVSATRDARLAFNATLGIEGPDQPIPPAALTQESRHYFDLAASISVGERFRFTLGVNNLFDTEPPLVGAQQVQANTDPSLYDVIGRRFFASVSAQLP